MGQRCPLPSGGSQKGVLLGPLHAEAGRFGLRAPKALESVRRRRACQMRGGAVARERRAERRVRRSDSLALRSLLVRRREAEGGKEPTALPHKIPASAA